MITIRERVLIRRPVEAVFAYMTEAENNREWQPGIVESRCEGEGSPRIGATLTITRYFLGRRFSQRYEITDWQPDKSCTIRSISGPFPVKAAYEFEAAEGGTLVSFEGEFEPGGFFRLAEPLLRRRVSREAKTAIDNLKDILETEFHSHVA